MHIFGMHISGIYNIKMLNVYMQLAQQYKSTKVLNTIYCILNFRLYVEYAGMYIYQ